MEVLAIRCNVFLPLLIIVTAAAAASFLSLSVHATDFSYCTKKLYPVTVSDVVISPDPVQTGKPVTFTIKAAGDHGFNGGKLVLSVLYYGIKVHGETDDICEKTSCPVSAGKFELSQTQTLPSITPPGLYTIRMSIKDDENQELSCIGFQFRIGFGVYDEFL